MSKITTLSFLLAENIPGGRLRCAIGPSSNGDGLTATAYYEH